MNTQWMFENAFLQVTNQGHDLLSVVPYTEIRKGTFENKEIFKTIKDLCGEEPNLNEESILFSTLKTIDNERDWTNTVNILLGKDPVNNLEQDEIDLLTTNNRIYKDQTTDRSLIIAAEFGYTDLYMKLVEMGHEPTYNVYFKSVFGNLEIMKHVNETIALPLTAIKKAFELDKTDMILFMIDNPYFKMSNDFASIPIANNNMQVVKYMDSKGLIKYNKRLVHSAVLSGSLEMLHYIESKLPDIHETRVLDCATSKKGQTTHITHDAIYKYNNSTFFSHTVNYAAQSGSAEMIEYITGLEYGVTNSNMITAIRYGTVDSVRSLAEHFIKVPFYINYLFMPMIYIADKMQKLDILLEYDLLTLEEPTKTVERNTDTSQLAIFLKHETLSKHAEYDPDFLLSHNIFFSGQTDYKTMAKMVIQIRTDNIKELPNINLMADMIALYGNMKQMKQIPKSALVNHALILQLIVYKKLGKISYILGNKHCTKEPFMVEIAQQLGYPLMVGILSKH